MSIGQLDPAIVKEEFEKLQESLRVAIRARIKSAEDAVALEEENKSLREDRDRLDDANIELNNELASEKAAHTETKNLYDLFCTNTRETLDGLRHELEKEQSTHIETRESLKTAQTLAQESIKRAQELQITNERYKRALEEIRNIDWGTDHCDAKNMIADEALELAESQNQMSDQNPAINNQDIAMNALADDVFKGDKYEVKV